MSRNIEFSECFEELDKLRSNYLQMQETCNDFLVKTATELANKEISCFKTANEFMNKLLTNSTALKECLETEDNAILMPNRHSVMNLISSTKAALKIHEELAARKDYVSSMDRKKSLFEGEKFKLNGIFCNDLNNNEFNRSVRTMVNYYNGCPDNEEFGDSTVNTIISEDVMTSSPI